MVRRLPDPVNAFHNEGVGILTTQEIGLAGVGRPPGEFRSYAACSAKTRLEDFSLTPPEKIRFT